MYGDDPVIGVEFVLEIGRKFPVVLYEQQQRQRLVLWSRLLLYDLCFGDGCCSGQRQYERGAGGVIGEFECPGVHFGKRTGEG